MDGMAETKTVSITTLGCKSNQYDSSALEEAFSRSGLSVLPFPARADAYVINTCTVTAKTDYQSRQLIRKVRKLNPEAIVVVTGCYAQVSPEEVSRIEGVDYIIGNPEKGKVVDYLLKGRQGEAKEAIGDWREGTPFTLRAHGSLGRTRANFKIQEGCNRSCSYCIIPRARGAAKSLPLPEIEKEITSLIEAGFKEIILTGIHLGAWGADIGNGSSIAAVLRLIEEKAFTCRFRISSIDPDEVTDEVVEILKSARRICNHLHLPLQSGDDAIIKKMHRPYTAKEFAERVNTLSKEIHEISIGADVIAGFPGEGEREFENTYSLLKDLPVSYLHVFPFSKRKGTPAATYPGQVNGPVIKERSERLRELDSLKRTGFYKGFVGKTATVLIEGARDKSGLLKGHARNYIPVTLEGPDINDTLSNEFMEIRLTSFDHTGMKGHLYKDAAV